VRLYSRPGNDMTRRFPLIAEALTGLRSRSCIIDGEAVAEGLGLPFGTLAGRQPLALFVQYRPYFGHKPFGVQSLAIVIQGCDVS
jgi:hypothetical protein